jgi:hypothetical protein
MQFTVFFMLLFFNTGSIFLRKLKGVYVTANHRELDNFGFFYTYGHLLVRSIYILGASKVAVWS